MRVRQVRRWPAAAPTVALAVDVIGTRNAKPAPWVSLAAVLPPAVLLLSGLQLFVLPYSANRHNA